MMWGRRGCESPSRHLGCTFPNLVQCLLKYVRKTPHGLCTASFEYVRVDLRGSELAVAKKPGQRVDIHTPGQLIDRKGVPSGMESHTLGDSCPHDPLR